MPRPCRRNARPRGRLNGPFARAPRIRRRAFRRQGRGMTLFLFAGDMLVMLFMSALVVWVFWRSPDKDIDAAARIPLEDERTEGDHAQR